MPPFLASWLVAILVLWLLRRDSKKSAGSPVALWITTIWVALLASRPLGYWIGGEGEGINFQAEAEGSPIDRNVTLALILLGLMVLKRRAIDWGAVFRRNRALWAFYAFALISVMWSVDPFVSFKRWIRELGTLIMILVILTDESPVEAVRQVFARCAYVLIPLSVLFIKYYPEIGRYYNSWTGEASYQGVSTGKNGMGRLAMLSGFIMLWSLLVQQRSGWLKWIKEGLPEMLILAMCIWILHIANSQTSLGGFVIGVVVLFGSRLSWVRANPKRLARLAWVLIVVSFFFFYFPDLRQIVTSSMGRNVNLTERTDVWSGVMALGTNPLIGTGFAGFWLTSEGQALGRRLNVGEAHNGYLETYLNGGLIGAGLLLAVLLVAGRNVSRQVVAGSATSSLFATLFVTGVIYNYTESNIGVGSIVGFVLWLVAMQYNDHGVAALLDESRQMEPCPTFEENTGACK
jgi:O-antigen ligase